MAPSKWISPAAGSQVRKPSRAASMLTTLVRYNTADPASGQAHQRHPARARAGRAGESAGRAAASWRRAVAERADATGRVSLESIPNGPKMAKFHRFNLRFNEIHVSNRRRSAKRRTRVGQAGQGSVGCRDKSISCVAGCCASTTRQFSEPRDWHISSLHGESAAMRRPAVGRYGAVLSAPPALPGRPREPHSRPLPQSKLKSRVVRGWPS